MTNDKRTIQEIAKTIAVKWASGIAPTNTNGLIETLTDDIADALTAERRRAQDEHTKDIKRIMVLDDEVASLQSRLQEAEKERDFAVNGNIQMQEVIAKHGEDLLKLRELEKEVGRLTEILKNPDPHLFMLKQIKELEARLAEMKKPVRVDGSAVDILRLSVENDELKVSLSKHKELLDLFIEKRSVDGLNGRNWEASRHLKAEEEIAKRLTSLEGDKLQGGQDAKRD